MVIVDRECAELIRNGASEELLRDHSARQGSVNLRADGMRWIAAGETTLDEVLRVTRASVESDA
jgi:general secretion pathway protein E